MKTEQLRTLQTLRVLREQRAGGRGHDEDGVAGDERIERLSPRLRAHHHSGAATVRSVIYCVVVILRRCAKIVNLNIH